MSVGIGLEQARSELEQQDRTRLARALRDLLRHHLGALASSDTFLAFGAPELQHGDAWRVLDEFREDHRWLAGIPSPRDSPAKTAGNLIDSAQRLGLSADEAALWKSRLLRFTEGARAAEMHLRSHREARPVGASDPPAVEAELEACLVECLLDRGAVREARACLQEHAELTARHPRLKQLLSWSLLCSGDYAGAKSAMIGSTIFAGVLPACLGDLRAERPEWLPCLAGRSPSDATPDASPDLSMDPRSAPRERAEVGASTLAVFAIGVGGQTLAVRVDAAPGLRSGLDAWLADRDGAYAVPGECEHEMVIGARPVTLRKDGELAIRAALGRERTLALALAPILDDHGEVAGWLHLECEHHRLPSRARLSAMATAWRADVLARAARAADLCGPSEESDLHWARAETSEATLCAAVFEALVADIGIKTAQRKWWGFVADSGELRLVTSGGEGGGLSTVGMRGKGRALTRALATRSRVSFDAPDARLSLDDKAASGVVLPLVADGILCGLLAIESSRRRDFRESDLVRIGALAEARGCAMRVARFVAWHRRRFGFEVWFDAGRPGFRSFAARLGAAARSRSPVVFVGPAGSGKTVLARWLHHESRRSEGPLRFVDCESLTTRVELRRRLDAAPDGSLVLEGLERLAPECQEELLRRIEGDEAPEGDVRADVRILGTTLTQLAPDPVGDSTSGTPRVREDLARRLDRVQIRLSALKERRGDILTLVGGFARRFGEEESLRTPVFSDETLALLWRQPWEGNARELENFVYKLVVFGPARRRGVPEIIQPEHVHEIAAQFSLKLASRLPSRHPSRSDLLAALRITRKPGGRLNKTRAALYLGWDPDTLVARMQDAGIAEDLADTSSDEGWNVVSARSVEPSIGSEPVASIDPSVPETDPRITPCGSSEVESRGATNLESGPESGEKREGPRALHDAHGP
jgi:putative methionine-R-sulfoxide reductase with GAF domain